MSEVLKTPSLVIISVVINALLFILIYQLVTNEAVDLPDYESLSFLEFIDIKQTQEPPEKKETQPKPEEPPPPEELPELPAKPQSETPDPAKPDVSMPSPDIDIPMGTGGLPYLGDFMKSAPPTVSPDTPEIDMNVVPTKKIDPVYPPRALRAGIEGTVTVQFTIDKQGNVKDIDIVRAEPPDIFNRAVIQALRRWKFPPATRDGKRIEKRAQQDIRFSLQGS